MSEERRSGARAVLSGVRVSYEGASGDRLEADATDLAAGGLFVRTDDPLPVGRRLSIELHVFGEPAPWAAVARVVWVREREEDGQPPGMGVKLIDADDTTLSSIAQLVESREPSGRGSISVVPPAVAERPPEPAPDALAPPPLAQLELDFTPPPPTAATAGEDEAATAPAPPVAKATEDEAQTVTRPSPETPIETVPETVLETASPPEPLPAPPLPPTSELAPSPELAPTPTPSQTPTPALSPAPAPAPSPAPEAPPPPLPRPPLPSTQDLLLSDLLEVSEAPVAASARAPPPLPSRPPHAQARRGVSPEALRWTRRVILALFAVAAGVALHALASGFLWPPQ